MKRQDTIKKDWLSPAELAVLKLRGFPQVAQDLQAMGFEVKAGLFSAYEVGASHQRRRLFMLAHANGYNERQQSGTKTKRNRIDNVGSDRSKRIANRVDSSGSNVEPVMVDGKSIGVKDCKDAFEIPLFAPSPSDFKSWHKVLSRRADLQPAFFGLDHGLANRMERCRAAGNGVVPLEAALAYRTLKASFVEVD